MTESKNCPHCGKPVPAEAPGHLCPECTMKAGLVTQAPAEGPGGTRLAQPAPETPPSPAELSRYFPQLEILECLGRGGMGVVYKARQLKLNRLVALKLLAPEKDAAPQFAERFLREAQTLARLNHPNIVIIHDFGEANSLFYLLMEYVDGVSLRQLLQAGRVVPEEALAIVPKICEALQFAHQHGVVHRDIKPENILLDRQGQVKIADFGIAKLVEPQGRGANLTAEKQIIGTPHYMAPEQVEQPHKVDHRADIYSLGVVFYELLTGELPLGKFQPPSHKVQVDVRLDEVVLRALAKEPERRYQQASQVKTAVETIGKCTGQSGNFGPAPEGGTSGPAQVTKGGAGGPRWPLSQGADPRTRWAVLLCLAGLLWLGVWAYIIHRHDSPAVLLADLAGFTALESAALVCGWNARCRLGKVTAAIAAVFTAAVLGFTVLVVWHDFLLVRNRSTEAPAPAMSEFLSQLPYPMVTVTVGWDGSQVQYPDLMAYLPALRRTPQYHDWLEVRDSRVFSDVNDAGYRFAAHLAGLGRNPEQGIQVELIPGVELFRPDGTRLAQTVLGVSDVVRWNTFIYDSTGTNVTVRLQWKRDEATHATFIQHITHNPDTDQEVTWAANRFGVVYSDLRGRRREDLEDAPYRPLAERAPISPP